METLPPITLPSKTTYYHVFLFIYLFIHCSLFLFDLFMLKWSLSCIISFIIVHFIYPSLSFVSYLWDLHIFSSSHSSFSTVNEVLIFKDSLIVLVPSSPISLPIHYHFFFTSLFSFLIISSHSRSSIVKDVFIFNDSLIVLAPSGPIWLSIHFSFNYFRYLLSFSFLIF